MSARRTLASISLWLLAIGSVFAAYLWSLSSSERWLLLCASDAEAYAEGALAGRTTDKWPPADCLADVVTATNSSDRTTLFSPHDNHEIAVIYAPGRSSEQLVYEQHVARRIRANWYALF
jgi:hypothetical protein